MRCKCFGLFIPILLQGTHTQFVTMRRCKNRNIILFVGLCVLLLIIIHVSDHYNSQRSDITSKTRLVPNVRRPLQTKRPIPISKPPRNLSSSVIILTYMRSGSSLLGDIMQQSPGAFYLFEPLHSLGRTYVTNRESNLTYVNGSKRLWPFSYQNEAINIIRSWLKCDVTKVLRRGLTDGFLEKGIRSRGFRNCFRRKRLTQNATQMRAYMSCAIGLKTKCKKSKVRVIKTIRMSMKMVLPLLDEIPDLKIIHLIRDPRATLRSQRAFGMCKEAVGGYKGCAHSLCTRQENDVLESEKLSKMYPNRIKSVLYESIAAKPIETSIELYRFVGAAFTGHARKYIFNITQAGNPRDCAICSTRPNSTLHISAWRQTIGDEFLKIIEDRCNYILQRLNYTLYSNSSVMMF